jgi:hypothetical protein
MTTFELADNRLIIQQGATYTLAINVTDSNGDTRDFSTYTARMQGRKKYSSTTTEFSLTSGSGITLGSVTPNITIEIDAVTTAAISAPSEGVYDLEIVNGPIVERVLEGKFTVAPEVTR